MPRHQKAALLKEHRKTLLLRGRNVFSAATLDETLDKTTCAYFEGIFLNIVQIYPLQIIPPPPSPWINVVVSSKECVSPGRLCEATLSLGRWLSLVEAVSQVEWFVGNRSYSWVMVKYCLPGYHFVILAEWNFTPFKVWVYYNVLPELTLRS